MSIQTGNGAGNFDRLQVAEARAADHWRDLVSACMAVTGSRDIIRGLLAPEGSAQRQHARTEAGAWLHAYEKRADEVIAQAAAGRPGDVATQAFNRIPSQPLHHGQDNEPSYEQAQPHRY